MQDRAVSPVRQRLGGPQGRVVTAYNAPMALEMCELVAAGETLSQICVPGRGFVARPTFHRWRLQHPELARAYNEARTISALIFEEESIDMAREIRATPGEAQRVRAYDIAMNHLRWVAARRNPQLFSEKAAVKVTVPIQINTGLDLGGSIMAQDVGKDGKSVYHVAATVHRQVVDIDEKPLLEGSKAMKRGLPRVLSEKKAAKEAKAQEDAQSGEE